MCLLSTKTSMHTYVSQPFLSNFGDSLKVNKGKILPVFLTNKNIQATAVWDCLSFAFCFVFPLYHLIP